MPLLSIRDLHVRFATDRGTVYAVNGVDLDVEAGETVGLVGESGSGKSVTSLAIMGLLPTPPAVIDRGTIRFAGQDLLALAPAALRRLRGARIAMVFQDPMTALNPFLRVGRQLTEVLEVHRGLPHRAARHRATAMLERVGIPDAARRIDAYPHELSGGMRQRVMIAMSLLCEPELLIADEPTTALDVTIQAQILELLAELQRDLGMALLLITHDLGVVAGAADRVQVLYGGRTMERAPTRALYGAPRHPYTQGLLRSVPRVDGALETLYSIPGAPPRLTSPLLGCPFAPRCAGAEPRCSTQDPPDRGEAGHEVLCWVPSTGMGA